MSSRLGNEIGIVRATILGTMMLAIGSATPVLAQVDSNENRISKEPVVVLSIASLDGLLGDVNHISTISGMPQAGAMLNIYVGAYSQGLDRSQPLGVLVRMIDGVPSPMVFLAISDVKAVLKRLEPQFGAADELEDGTMVMQAGQSLIYIRNQDEWSYLSNQRTALDDLPEDPKDLLHGLHLDHDIGIRANLQQVPEPMRMALVSQMRQAFDDAVKRIQEQAEGEAKPEVPNEAVIKQMETMMRETEYLTLGISIDAENNHVAIDMASTAVDGSELAQMYNERKPVPTEFAGFLRPDAAAYLHFSASFGSKEQEVSLRSIDQSVKQLQGALGSNVKLSDDDKKKIDAYVPRVKELLAANIRSGKANGGGIAVTDEHNLRVLFGGTVAEGKKIEQLAKDIFGEFADNPDAPKIKFDDGQYAGMTLHRGEVTIPEDMEELNKMFGDKLPLLIATSENRFFVGAGNGVEDLLKQTVESSGQTPAEELPLAEGSISLLPAMEFAYWVDDNAVVDLLLETLDNNPENDNIEFVQPTEPNGQRVRITIDDGVMQVIGAGAQAGKARPQF